MYTCRKQFNLQALLEPSLHASWGNICRISTGRILGKQRLLGAPECWNGITLEVQDSPLKSIKFDLWGGWKNTPLPRNGIFLPECFGRPKHARWNTPPSEVFLEDHRQIQNSGKSGGRLAFLTPEKIGPNHNSNMIPNFSQEKVLAFLFQPPRSKTLDRTSINSAEMLFLMPTLPRGERLLRADLWSRRMHWANCARSDELKLKQHDIGWSYLNMKDRIECAVNKTNTFPSHQNVKVLSEGLVYSGNLSTGSSSHLKSLFPLHPAQNKNPCGYDMSMWPFCCCTVSCVRFLVWFKKSLRKEEWIQIQVLHPTKLYPPGNDHISHYGIC